MATGKNNPFGLNHRQERFVHEYLIDLNITQAAIRAGYSENTAAQTGCNLFRNPKVQAAVQAGKEKRCEQTSITAARVLEEIACLAFANAANFVDRDGKPIPLHKLREADARAVQMFDMELEEIIEEDEGKARKKGKKAPALAKVRKITCKMRLHDKRGALQQLGVHTGLFVTDRFKIQLDPEDPFANALKAAMGTTLKPTETPRDDT